PAHDALADRRADRSAAAGARAGRCAHDALEHRRQSLRRAGLDPGLTQLSAHNDGVGRLCPQRAGVRAVAKRAGGGEGEGRWQRAK
ncbi:MAG: hypothetical protein ACK55I_44125, partial [bacterium]